MWEKRRRDELLYRKDEVTENKRAAYLNRESDKWNKMDTEFQHCVDILEKKKKVLAEAGTYSNGYALDYARMAYNPITLEYHTSNKGEKLKERDDNAALRGKLRSKNLDIRSNTGYNILTGENRKGVDVPKEMFEKYQESLLLPKKRFNNIW